MPSRTAGGAATSGSTAAPADGLIRRNARRATSARSSGPSLTAATSASAGDPAASQPSTPATNSPAAIPASPPTWACQ